MASRAVAMYQQHVTESKLNYAKKLIDAEQIEGAAMIYQELGMWKEAGDLRRRARQQVMTQVHVNVNELIDQLKKAGISTNYTCPVCGGHIPITGETNLSKLYGCQFCGSVIQTTDLVEFLTKVVGYK
jgi:hypothetical protein